ALQDIIPFINKTVFTYGTTAQADVRAIDIEFEGFSSKYTVIYKGKELGNVKLNIPGEHYVKNSLVAVTIGMELGIDFNVIKKALEKFKGVYRRFETKYKNDILVLDDYAHHPTESSATLAGIRAAWDKRLVVVFQPHLYSRTKDFYQDFGRSFLNSDVFVCTDIYPAREKPIEGVTGEMIANITKKYGHKNVIYVPDKKDIPKKLMELKKKNDIIITMGAGDIWKYGEKFVELLKEEKH
nr:Mur ligase family protein [Ignavibacteriaceae bacterium]